MYQPKIKDELIPKLYRLAKACGVPMTPFVVISPVAQWP